MLLIGGGEHFVGEVQPTVALADSGVEKVARVQYPLTKGTMIQGIKTKINKKTTGAKPTSNTLTVIAGEEAEVMEEEAEVALGVTGRDTLEEEAFVHNKRK